MSWRTTGALFIILLVVAALVFLQNQQDGAEEVSEAPTFQPPTSLFPEISGDAVQRLDIERAEDGVRAVYERQEGGTDWYRIVPTYTLAISQTLTSRLAGLTNLAARDTVLAGQNPRSAYGLDQPAHTISFLVPRDGQMVRYRIYVGYETPVGNYYYVAKEGDPRIFITLRTTIDNILSFLDTPPIPEPTPNPAAEAAPTP